MRARYSFVYALCAVALSLSVAGAALPGSGPAAAAAMAGGHGGDAGAPFLDPAGGQWPAQSVVHEVDIEITGLDAWFRSEPISDEIFRRMWLKSWKENCPLRRSELRYLKMLHRNAQGQPQRGEMVVNAAIADKVLRIFKKLYEADYRIERMVLIDEYGASDESSMSANNTSAFNFRFMTGSTTKISKHGLGLAVDLNSLYNPYVKQNKDGSWHVEPQSGRPWAFDRASRTDIPYEIDKEDLAYRLFIAEGFTWGGSWKSLKDYQHFEYSLKN